MEASSCAEACSAVIDAKAPIGSERIERDEDCLVIGNINASFAIAAIRDGVFAGLAPLRTVPLNGGVPCWDLPGLSIISRGGDLDFFRGSDEPDIPSTFDAATLDVSDATTFSTVI